MTNLEKLNELLRNATIKVPDHVREVHDSGKNQLWLRKNLKNADVDPEIKRLLNLTTGELKKAYTAPDK